MRWLACLMLLWLCSCAPQEGVLLRVNLAVTPPLPNDLKVDQLEFFVGTFKDNGSPTGFAPNRPVFVRDNNVKDNNVFDVSKYPQRFDLLLPDDEIPTLPEWREVLVVGSAAGMPVAFGTVKVNRTAGRVNIYEVPLKPTALEDFATTSGCTRWPAGVIMDAGVTACPPLNCMKTGKEDTCDGEDDNCDGMSPNIQNRPEPLRCLRADAALACGLSANSICDDYKHMGDDYFVCAEPAVVTCLDKDHCKDFVSNNNRYDSEASLIQAYEALFKKIDYTCEIRVGDNGIPCGLDPIEGLKQTIALGFIPNLGLCPALQNVYVDPLLHRDGDWVLVPELLDGACRGRFTLKVPAPATLTDPKHMLVGVSRSGGLPNIGLVVELKKKQANCNQSNPAIVECVGKLPESCSP